MVVYSSGKQDSVLKSRTWEYEYLAVLLNESLFIKWLPKELQVISAKSGLKLVNMQQFASHYLDELL